MPARYALAVVGSARNHGNIGYKSKREISSKMNGMTVVVLEVRVFQGGRQKRLIVAFEIRYILYKADRKEIFEFSFQLLDIDLC